MTSNQLAKIFARCREGILFDDWNSGRLFRPSFIYACELGTIWKFTPKAWWEEVNRALKNEGRHEFQFSSACRRPKFILNSSDGSFHSTNPNIRCVNPGGWTLEDWKGELLK